jgi:hypothetical protein
MPMEMRLKLSKRRTSRAVYATESRSLIRSLRSIRDEHTAGHGVRRGLPEQVLGAHHSTFPSTILYSKSNYVKE